MVIGAVVGFVSAMVVFGPTFLWGDPAYWDYLYGDAGSGMAGFRTFLAEPWGFPLLRIHGMNDPTGINIAFTDSLPAWALVAKVLAPLGIPVEAWWGWWYVGLHVAQGATAALATRAWGNRSPVVSAGVAGIAVSAPILLYRVGHPGLAAQFLLLAAWAFVGELRTDGPTPSWRVVTTTGVALAVLALLTHVYLLLGVVVTMGAGVADLVSSGRRRISDGVAWSTTVGGSVLVIAVVMGYFSAGASKVEGYDRYGMHVFNPVVPQDSTLWSGDDRVLVSSGSGESFNWLGVGWWMLIVAAAVVLWDLHRSSGVRIGARLRAHQLSLAAMACLTMYAITPAVRLWDDDPHDLRTPIGWLVSDDVLRRRLLGLGLFLVAAIAGLVARRWIDRRWWPSVGLVLAAAVALSVSLLVVRQPVDLVTGQFRVAGRLFWTVSYGALVVAGGLLGREAGSPVRRPAARRAFVAVVLCCAGIQVVDVSIVREQSSAINDPTPERTERFDRIETLLAGAERVVLEPALNCAGVYGDQEGATAFQNVGIVASHTLTPVSRVYAARREEQRCHEPVVVTLAEGEALVLVAPEAIADDLLVVDPAWTCDRYELLLVCR